MKETETHIYFWGNSAFSNFFMSSFKYKENLFSNSEQAFMWEKARTFRNEESADLILNTIDPDECKRLGRLVKGYEDKIWSGLRYDIMKKINIEKWSQSKFLKSLLLSTGDKILVEASPKDNIWGVGFKYDDPLVLDDSNWTGQNLLGKVLMEVRKIISESE